MVEQGRVEELWSSDRVVRRAEDWLARLEGLRTFVDEAIRGIPGLTIADRDPIQMDEDLMRRFEVSPRSMPVFDVMKGNKPVARFRPKGLWVIGANGRVDLTTPAGSWFIVDSAEPLSTADWHIASMADKRSLGRLSRQGLIEILRQALG